MRSSLASSLLFFIALLLLIGIEVSAQAPPQLSGLESSSNTLPYNIGSPLLKDIFVSPTGTEANDGSTRDKPTTLSNAWNRLVPRSGSDAGLTTGYRIYLLPGTYPNAPNFMENAWGTQQFPIVIQSVTPGSAILTHDFNVFNCRYLYLIDLIFQTAGDSLHFEACQHILIRNVKADGAGAAQETLKVNQCQFFYVENCELSGTYENGLDYVAVQYGHVLNTSIHDAGDWCAYVKGGSSYIRFDSNTLYNCGTGGFTAGQGTGFEFMTPPWIYYEATDIKFTNNVVRNTEGACFGCNGCAFTLFAFNNCTQVGSRSHLIEVVPGARSCDGNQTRCTQLRSQGGWGPGRPITNGPNDGGEFIPSHEVIVFGNTVINSGMQSGSQHFSVHGPQTPITAQTGVPAPVLSDDRLVISGNYIRNGGSEMPIGPGDEGAGCQATNPTCNRAQLLRDNRFNNDSSPLPPTNVVPDFGEWSGGVLGQIPKGVTSNAMVVRSGGGGGGIVTVGTTRTVVATSTAGQASATSVVGTATSSVVQSTVSTTSKPSSAGKLVERSNYFVGFILLLLCV